MCTFVLQPLFMIFLRKFQIPHLNFRIYVYDCHKQSRLKGESDDWNEFVNQLN